MYQPASWRSTGYHPGMAQAAPAASAAPVSGAWYSTMWSEPALLGVPVVPTFLGLGILVAAILLLGARR